MIYRQEGLGFSTLSPWGEPWNSDVPLIFTPLLDFTDFNKHFSSFGFLRDTESARCQLDGCSSRDISLSPAITDTGAWVRSGRSRHERKKKGMNKGVRFFHLLCSYTGGPKSEWVLNKGDTDTCI